MENAPKKTDYNIEMKIVAILERMEVRTTEPYPPWQKNAEIVIKIIKGKVKRRKVHRNIPMRVWDSGMVCEAKIYSRTAGKYGRPSLEQSTGDTVDISEYLEF